MNTVTPTAGVTTTAATSTGAAISARGLRKSFGEKTVLDGIDLTVPQGTIFALLGPNGAGKTTAVHLLTTYLRPDAGEIRIAGQDPAKNPQAVRRAIGVTGQFSAVDGYLTGRENLMLMAELPPAAARRSDAGGPRSCSSGSSWPRPADKPRVDLLRRDEAQARPGHDPGRQPEDHLPRRADHGPRPAQPAHDVGDHPRAGRRGRRPSCSPPSTWRRPTSSPTASRCSTAAGSSPRAPPPSSRRASPAGTSSWPSPTAPNSTPPRWCSARPTATTTALTLQLPSDGRVSTAADAARQLDDASVEVEALTVHTPDLDDVFFALTGKQGA